MWAAAGSRNQFWGNGPKCAVAAAPGASWPLPRRTQRVARAPFTLHTRLLPYPLLFSPIHVFTLIYFFKCVSRPRPRSSPLTWRVHNAQDSLHARSYPPRLSRKYPGADHEAIALPRLDINLHVSKIGKGDSPATGAVLAAVDADRPGRHSCAETRPCRPLFKPALT